MAGPGYTALRGAEVLNLERTVVVTGSDFTHVACDNGAKTCTDGLHQSPQPHAILRRETAFFRHFIDKNSV